MTYVIGNLFFEAIKKICFIATTNFKTIDRWFHMPEQEQDLCYQGFGLCQQKTLILKKLSSENPNIWLKILTSKTRISLKQARMVEFGSRSALTKGSLAICLWISLERIDIRIYRIESQVNSKEKYIKKNIKINRKLFGDSY